MFYTTSNLRRLCNSNTLFADGTFRTAPRLFRQFYTVHGIVENNVYPLVFCLDTRKTETMYTEIIEQLKHRTAMLGFNLSPHRVRVDLEMAVMNSIRLILPGTRVIGCLFHYGQVIWRQTTSFGLRSAYDNDVAVKNSVNYLLALPWLIFLMFLIRYIMQLKRQSSLFGNMSKQVYVRGRRVRGRRRASTPLFPPEIWNAYESCLNGFIRTNNFMEAWPSKFAKVIATKHSQLWNFIEQI